MSLHFSFLVLEEHPYGREMLRILLENNLVPSMIIQEVSNVGDEEREKFLKCRANPQSTHIRAYSPGYVGQRR